jgi:hypothetical protein
MTAAQRLGMGNYFFDRMDEFTAHRERYQDLLFQTAAGEVDLALSETIKYMSAEQAGRQPVKTKEELSNLWQAAGRAVAPLDPDFSQACFYKALGWLKPEEWHRANELGVKTDLDFITSERAKLIQLARLPRTPKQIEPETSDHLVILIHGFNTFARWMDDVKEALRQRGFAASATGFGYFGFPRFLSFPACRKNAVRLVIIDIDLSIAQYQNEHNGQGPKKMSVIAHSFGTWLLMRILEDNQRYKFYRIIFCGSIFRNDFDLSNLYAKGQFEKIVNHIGTKDYWPAIGESAGWGYGSIGSMGLLSPVADNRWHTDFKHSDFLTPTFCTSSWIPFLEGDHPPPGDPWKELPFWVRAVTFIPLRWIIMLLVLASISLVAAAGVRLGVAVISQQEKLKEATTALTELSSPKATTAQRSVTITISPSSSNAGEQTASLSSFSQMNVVFANRTSETAKLYWVDFNGVEVFYESVSPGALSASFQTYVGHLWIVKTETGNVLMKYVVKAP